MRCDRQAVLSEGQPRPSKKKDHRGRISGHKRLGRGPRQEQLTIPTPKGNGIRPTLTKERMELLGDTTSSSLDTPTGAHLADKVRKIEANKCRRWDGGDS